MVVGFDASRVFVSEPTGTENYSYQLLKALAKIDRKNSYRVYLASQVFDPEGSDRRGETLQGWPENFSFKVINWPRFWTQGGLALECLINPPDVLFIPAHTLPIIRRPRLKTVVTIHDLGAEYLPQYHQFPQKYYLNWSTIYAVKNATRIIVVSESTKRDLITKLQCDIEVIRVIYEGLNQRHKMPKSPPRRDPAAAGPVRHDSFATIAKKYNIQKPYILFVGTIQPRKNLARLVEAFSRIRIDPNGYSELIRMKGKRNSGSFGQKIRMNSDLQLVIAGKPGWLYDEIYKAPKKFGIEDRVKFLGFVDGEDLAVIYEEASVFCLPSLYEGFGLPVLEAMAAGVPVVAAKTSSLPEVAGDSGLLIDPYNVDDIAKGLEKVLLDEKLRKTLIEKGLARVKNFTWEKTARETLKVLEEAHKNGS